MGILSATPIAESFPASAAPVEWHRIAALLRNLPLLQTLAARRPHRMAVKAKGRIVFLNLAEVITVEAKGNDVLLEGKTTRHTLREPLSTVAAKLAAHGFVRIHRSVLVNAAFVREIQPWPTGEYVLRMESGKEYTVTRTYKKNLNLLAASWLGTGGVAAE
jgi:two-component system, LytTR family, response regulator